MGLKFGFLKKLLNDDRGQSTVEYILMLSVVVMIAIQFKKTFQSKLTGIVNNLGKDIDTATQDTMNN